MQFFTRKRRQPPAVIIISLIDVLIVMLIFLMVTTTFKQHPTLKLALPESKQAKEGVTENQLLIELAPAEPHFAVAGRAVTLDMLQQILSATARTNPNVIISIRPDKNAPIGKWVSVVDAAKAAGIKTPINMQVTEPAR